MIDNRHLCVLDFETGGKDKTSCEVLSIGSVIIHSGTLQIIDEFTSLVQPRNFDALEEEALKVNGLTREQLAEAPLPDIIFPAWAKWIQNHNITKDNNSFGAPIPTGWNINNFDLPILDRYCKEFKYWDKKWGSRTLLNPVFTFDVMTEIWLLTRTNPDTKNCKLGDMAIFMGKSEEDVTANAHEVMWDVRTTAEIAIRYLKLMKYLTDYNPATGNRRITLKGCLSK